MRLSRRQLVIASTLATLAAPVMAADKFLDVLAAFKFTSRRIDASTVELRWQIAPGYYMYRDRFKFTADGASIAAPVLPRGDRKFDENFGEEMEIYKTEVVVPVKLTAAASGAFTIKAIAQGCAEAGLCYPPQPFTARVDVAKT